MGETGRRGERHTEVEDGAAAARGLARGSARSEGRGSGDGPEDGGHHDSESSDERTDSKVGLRAACKIWSGAVEARCDEEKRTSR